jgi:hypothetical protein
MKTVKILSMTLLMSILCVGMAFAQQQAKGQQAPRAKATPEERAAKQVERMQKTYNLSSEQVNRLKAVQTQFAKEQEQTTAGVKGNREDMKAKAEAYDAQVKSILTPEQYQKYQDDRKNMMKNAEGQKNKAEGNFNKDSKIKKDVNANVTKSEAKANKDAKRKAIKKAKQENQ